jgi:hypothetical protein
MTVGEMKRLLNPIANDVVIVMGEVGDDFNLLQDICDNSGLEEIDFDGEPENMFILLPCHCEEEEVDPSLN